MASEESPLLLSDQDHNAGKHEAVYRRFSPGKKRLIVAMVSLCGLIPLFVTGSFTPAIPVVAKELDSTGTIVNLAVSLSSFATSLGGLIGGSYSTFYGRRPMYTFSLPVLVFASAGVATAASIPALLFWRFMQSIGASPGMVLGAGVIGDIYKLEERGRAMGIFFAACLFGPALAPLVGGTVAYYYSWRAMQGFLGVVGFLIFCMIYCWFPETSQPGSRGVDKMRAESGENTKHHFYFINPLRPLLLLRSPNLLLISVILSASLLSFFVLVIPIAYTIGTRYNIASEALVGACFLPSGFGTICGAQIVGRISDYTVIRWRKKRGGVWYPEDRLRASLIPFAILVPIPLLAFGVINQYADGRQGLIGCLVCLFFNGLGIEMAFGPCAAYLVDVMHSRSTDILAANAGLRSTLMAAGIAVILPMINTYGIAVTNALSAVMVWISFGILCCIIQYGDRMRAYCDVGFSTAETN